MVEKSNIFANRKAIETVAVALSFCKFLPIVLIKTRTIEKKVSY